MSQPADPTIPPHDLTTLRAQIDAVDEQIVRLLNERAQVVVQIGKVKQQSNEPIYAPDREKAVFDKIARLNGGPLPDRCLTAVYRELMSGSFALERPLKIGFLGPEGSYSSQAAALKFGQSVSYVPLADINAVLEEVVRGHIDYGLVPVENSIGGGVVDTLDAFMHSSARVCAEVLLPIHHCVMSRHPWANVTRLVSKEQVFAQCRRWLGTVASGREQIPWDSTSGAAKFAASDLSDANEQVRVAAIAPLSVAAQYGLNVLFENVEDNPDNVTRFWVVSKEMSRKTGDDKTAILFTTSHKPGALADVLDVFKSAGINLTDIEKRPSKKVNWEYYFFIDTQGHADDPTMRAAIESARKHCLHLSVLGSYPRATAPL